MVFNYQLIYDTTLRFRLYRLILIEYGFCDGEKVLLRFVVGWLRVDLMSGVAMVIIINFGCCNLLVHKGV